MVKRQNLGKLSDVLEMPDLISVQLESYANFLQLDVPPEQRKRQGLQEIFMDSFPVVSFSGNQELHFVSYEIGFNGVPKNSVIDCIKDGKIYEVPLYVNFVLKRNGTDIPEKVYMGDIPMMTPSGTFIINGAERVIISQLHRSPGICFEKNKATNGSKELFSCKIIPDRGSWLDIQCDANDVLRVFLDKRKRRRKFNLNTFLRAIGYETNEDILRQFYKVERKKLTSLAKLDSNKLSSYYTVNAVITEQGLEVVPAFKSLMDDDVHKLLENDIQEVLVAYVEHKERNALFITLAKDSDVDCRDKALEHIFSMMRPGEPINLGTGAQIVKRLFFDERRYDLGLVGRFKINERLHHGISEELRVLDPKDIVEATRMLIDLRYQPNGQPDDIDHLGVRRVRTVGELLQNQCRQGILRMERMIREKMSGDEESMKPSSLVNNKTFSSTVKDFFARSQLSQFMDQVNPLSELTNKRRLSALGPGGLSRERAGFEVRDVHVSHYGRICPIETPEGPNIGLISSLALYSKINRYGFLETPYRKVVDGKVTNEIEYLVADKEEKFVIAQANALLDKDNRFVRENVMCRYNGEFEAHSRDEVQYMDVSPKQVISAAAGVIPFLEHDDANRALMGSNMQRQAVSLLMPEAPLVGTGLEERVARDSRAIVVAQEAGTVTSVSAGRIEVTPDDGSPVHTYELYKYLRSNAGTCINQRPVIKRDTHVVPGDLLADGAATQGGELALGRNVLVAFMPWCGYNFEDAIIVSERLIKEDVFTSVHIDEFEVQRRDTKLGAEEITRDISNISEDARRLLDSRGIVFEGAEVSPGDILVGKITPRGESDPAPIERLLRAVFSEKADNYKDSSLLVPTGKGGIVMDVRTDVYHDSERRTLNKSERKAMEKAQKQELKDQYNNLFNEMVERLNDALLGTKLEEQVETRVGIGEEPDVIIPANRKITKSMISKLAKNHAKWHMEDCDSKAALLDVFKIYSPQLLETDSKLKSREAKEIMADNEVVDDGIINRVKIYLGSKRKLQVGDKMAGRHGNKGIVSRIVPVEDMPFLADGTPVDIILNPLGVPSRMNIGQVLETHLGWAAKMLGIKVATPVFDGADENTIIDMMKQANEKNAAETGHNYHWGFKQNADGEWVYDGKTDVYDGRTGDRFDQRIMVGEIYMLKLDHLVANKIHARATGPYSLVTQQPLGGKAQAGGQRFGEMEVWALEAYGAAYTLQEMLTVKSDDCDGRNRIFKSITEGNGTLQAGRPESFNVLLKELQALALDVRTVKNETHGLRAQNAEQDETEAVESEN